MKTIMLSSQENTCKMLNNSYFCQKTKTALLLSLKKCRHMSQWYLHGVILRCDIYTVPKSYTFFFVMEKAWRFFLHTQTF